MNAPTSRGPISLLITGLALVALAYVLAFAGASASAPWALALGATLVLTAMLWLGGRRRGRLPRALAAACVIAALATFGGFSYALLAPAPTSEGALLLGIPRTAAILLSLVGAVPMFALPLLYAAAFDDE
jgi:hypothetical protein